MATSNDQQKLLKFSSYEELKEDSKLEKKLIGTLKKLDLKK